LAGAQCGICTANDKDSAAVGKQSRGVSAPGSIHGGSGRVQSKLLNPSVVDSDWGTTVTPVVTAICQDELAPPVRMKRPLPLSEVTVVLRARFGHVGKQGRERAL